MGEDERNDSLFIFDEHKNSYIQVTRNQIFVDDISPNVTESDLDSFSREVLRITAGFKQIPREIRLALFGNFVDNNWRKLHSLPMRRRYRK